MTSRMSMTWIVGIPEGLLMESTISISFINIMINIA